MYKIEAVIKGEKCNLNNINELPIETDLDALKFMVRGYVANEFNDIVDSLNDITSIKLKKGKNCLYDFTY